MDDEGIHTGSSVGMVNWEDVTQLRVDSIRGNKILFVFVCDPKKYLDRMSPLARKNAELSLAAGFSEIIISFVGLTPGLDDACYYLVERGYQIENL